MERVICHHFRTNEAPLKFCVDGPSSLSHDKGDEIIDIHCDINETLRPKVDIEANSKAKS